MHMIRVLNGVYPKETGMQGFKRTRNRSKESIVEIGYESGSKKHPPGINRKYEYNTNTNTHPKCIHRNISIRANKSKNCKECGIFMNSRGQLAIREDKLGFKVEVCPSELQKNMEESNIVGLGEGGCEKRLRRVMVDWLCEVGEVFNLSNGTIHRAVYYFDIVMARNPNVIREDVQLIALTSLLTAGKYIELDRKIPSMNTLLKACKGKYNIYKFKKEEVKVLGILNFNLSFTIPIDFVDLFLAQGIYFQGDILPSAPSTKPNKKIPEYLRKYAEFFADLCLQESIFYKYKVVEVACGIIAAARRALKFKNIWTDNLVQLTGISFTRIEGCLRDLYRFYYEMFPNVKNEDQKESSKATTKAESPKEESTDMSTTSGTPSPGEEHPIPMNSRIYMATRGPVPSPTLRPGIVSPVEEPPQRLFPERLNLPIYNKSRQLNGLPRASSRESMREEKGNSLINRFNAFGAKNRNKIEDKKDILVSNGIGCRSSVNTHSVIGVGGNKPPLRPKREEVRGELVRNYEQQSKELRGIVRSESYNSTLEDRIQKVIRNNMSRGKRDINTGINTNRNINTTNINAINTTNTTNTTKNNRIEGIRAEYFSSITNTQTLNTSTYRSRSRGCSLKDNSAMEGKIRRLPLFLKSGCNANASFRAASRDNLVISATSSRIQLSRGSSASGAPANTTKGRSGLQLSGIERCNSHRGGYTDYSNLIYKPTRRV